MKHTATILGIGMIALGATACAAEPSEPVVVSVTSTTTQTHTTTPTPTTSTTVTPEPEPETAPQRQVPAAPPQGQGAQQGGAADDPALEGWYSSPDNPVLRDYYEGGNQNLSSGEIQSWWTDCIATNSTEYCRANDPYQ